MEISALQKARSSYQPKLPKGLRGNVDIIEGAPTESVGDQAEIKRLFPHTYGMPLVEFAPAKEVKEYAPINVGIILSGGQAPGGHNVICGLFDELKKQNPKSKLYGFLMGPSGLVDHKYKELTAEVIDKYRNTGGFDMIGSGRTKLETKEQFDSGLEIIRQLNLNAVIIIGGDDSNTNACMLAEYYASINAGVSVIGCPKTIDGDLKNDQIETSFGFDSACKTYSELIGNIQRDANSARKYWHFIKLMGRSASHIALECALQTQPNICIISEEVEANNMTLDDVVNQICEVVVKRSEEGLYYGTILIPEGLIEFVPAFKRLIAELSDLLSSDLAKTEAKGLKSDDLLAWILNHVSAENLPTLKSLPEEVAKQLALGRDPHGNVQVSLIETEKMLSEMCAKRLDEWKEQGKFKGKFAALHHFFGYEGRCATPSNFDCNYCYALGTSAAQLVANGKTGYMAIVKNTTAPAEDWVAGGVPITKMMNLERRNGQMKPVIKKALVLLDGEPFKELVERRKDWAVNTRYVYPGPIQYFGPLEVCDQCTMTLALEHKK
ncbi:diphosphate--fructose-6-phosphate 1-phosphotransferase [Alloprevotella tannerae]|uniref:diphosphate--fructose-6-phosphate 1-phosphotransferase n=1 Tax=Alloprevotella tannerae TaxID=76122 RepID=UPI001EDB6E2A|nr:diphosphate--fructose-6-phosphate 1-phosphotransferase [Alloprevotella tannerae]MCG2651136.1 diphosphate--fructose-6-phosphate 1-phosphotransferase [Alloprevotella tannerae]